MAKKKVLIIGNGFDLDLGWKTDYRSFIESDIRPLDKEGLDCPMREYMVSHIVDRWFDVESILRDYASPGRINSKADSRDSAFFHAFKTDLTSYLKQEEGKAIRRDSMAVRVLGAIARNGLFSSVYSFNYTDLDLVCQKAGITTRLQYESVHGSIRDNTIILGIDDKSDVREGYSYLRKVFSEHYKSHPIRYDLQECNEVVFFGHSLGDNDYPYFSDFFEAQSQCQSKNESKIITIFTKDNASRIQIMEQLRVMNYAQTERLVNDNVFRIIMTDEPNRESVDSFFRHLSIDYRHPVQDPMVY